ncbi:phosphoenolpyruvate carboxylase [Haladaptatus paucihalophilus DX253]|uniref:phosphoenolpyruvate carboxylase n=1 Tax=Haladaptatus paucihalophilus DX253 TaxID=797209 RepID=E7QR15_HALPU|nr:phosphoenolpyruvate carboxylase [Haladaptatus paucihalophilus]EFW93429.1 phosphoenolpyruvate carboxylase [Haladaptatus paucihalophilus DX253]SHK54460.1 Phosphoenolpyruvate carboxylase, type 1 [Haladaptatus paucihalophilus DX253]
MRLHTRDVRQDVRELGGLLGDVLSRLASREAFESVETVRTGSIDYRRGDAESRAVLRDEVADLSPELAGHVARAFATYFELINLAEERQRVRAIREGTQEGTLEDSLRATAETLAEADADPETVERVLEDVNVVPTFTAHPTEARRKTVKAKLRSVETLLSELDERRLTDRERNQLERRLESEVTGLWETRQVRKRRPEVADEARNVLWYLENVLFDIVGDVYDELDHTVGEEFDVDVPKLFGFRSWAGSDRDGNPHVTPEVTAETLDRQRDVVLERYRDELKRLSGVLSQDGDRIETSALFDSSLDTDREQLPTIAERVTDRYPEEPYRQKLALMRERIDRVGDVRPGGYHDAEELLADVDAIADSLRKDGAESVVETEVEPLRRRVETFGFSLAALDLRDHQENHTTAIAEALAREGFDYDSMSEDERVELLTDAILQDEPIIDLDTEGLSETASRVLTLFSETADWQREYGAETIDTYCISMTEEASHVLEVLFLADQAGIVDLPGYSGLDVVPLLETEYALSGARRIVGTLFENEAYAAALEARGGTQEIMLGYSDSNKENGFLAANWSLYRNQKRLAEITEEYDVTLRLFHGRGGSISRGGGPMNEALLALPRETVSGQVKFTEQGEAIAEKYANPVIAERNVEQMLDAQIRARYAALEDDEETIPDEWVEAMDVAADAARDAYRDLLESDGFVSYFEETTPITVIEDLNLGSRPASRSGERTVEDLRAIPWVFSWTQSRCILPGWYSLAKGLDAYGDVETLREMYEEWPFFRTTIDNAAMALARTDLEITAEYADLASPKLREQFFPELEAEYERSAELVLDITGRDDLLSREWLRESLDRRNPYVDPLNLLQVRLLRQSHLTETERRTLRLTVTGVAAGMKNTG